MTFYDTPTIFFVGIIQEFLSLATDGDVTADYEDISLLPEQDPCYALAPQLKNNTVDHGLQVTTARGSIPCQHDIPVTRPLAWP
jgi:hypothetical protein